jgi:DNA-binding response OmpR family regulator
VLSASVVDDETMLAKFIQTYLSFEGFKVRGPDPAAAPADLWVDKQVR